VKVKRFIEKYKLSLDDLNQLFYKEDGEVQPLFDDLKTTRASESQIRITLLQCLLKAIHTGDFQTEVEFVREDAKARKCYDTNNWAQIYNNSAGLFDFEKYGRDTKIVTLSESGKAALAELVKELR
jgi:hypothetical protein